MPWIAILFFFENHKSSFLRLANLTGFVRSIAHSTALVAIIDVAIANVCSVTAKHGCFSRVLLALQSWNVH
jgi:hypothetical protein